MISSSTSNFAGTKRDVYKRQVQCRVKTRYRQPEQPATIEQIGEDLLKVTFHEPQRAVTPGQAAVFYDGDTVLGGGTIVTKAQLK